MHRETGGSTCVDDETLQQVAKTYSMHELKNGVVGLYTGDKFIVVTFHELDKLFCVPKLWAFWFSSLFTL